MTHRSSARSVFGLLLVLSALLAACGTVPVAGTALPQATTAPTSEPTGGAIVITSGPAGVTQTPWPTAAPSTPIPTPFSGASPTALKYQVLAAFPDFFFCDPDYYPVARGDEAELAQERFPELQADAEEFQAILEQTGLSGIPTLSDEQKLLIYREHKRLAAIAFDPVGEQYRFQIQVAEQEGQGFLITGLVDSRGNITVENRESVIVSCPRCLATGTRIDTPRGPVAVEALRSGDLIWTANATGARRPAIVVETAHMPVPAGHAVVHVVLQDGRALWASPEHPTAAGRPLGRLQVGDLLDGARVVHVTLVPYEGTATHDLLPSGDTGLYWANGVLVGSTLAHR